MPCDTCAFQPGCITHDDEPYNRLKSEIAALAGMPFWCHHRKDGGDWPWNSPTAPIEFFKMHPGMRKVCDGWKARVKELSADGRFGDKERREELKEWGRAAYEAIDKFIAATDPIDKELSLNCLKVSLHYLRGGDDKTSPPLVQITGAVNG